jgi:hypothetical protein
MSKFDLQVPVKIIVIGNSNFVEVKKEKDVTELSVGTDGFLWQTGRDASGKPQK